MTAITYIKDLVTRVASLANPKSPNSHFKPENGGHIWIEILDAKGRVLSPELLNLSALDYVGFLGDMVDTTASGIDNICTPRPDKEEFVFWSAKVVIGEDGKIGFDDKRIYYYANGKEYFLVSPLDLLDHNIRHVPAILEVRIHKT